MVMTAGVWIWKRAMYIIGYTTVGHGQKPLQVFSLSGIPKETEAFLAVESEGLVPGWKILFQCDCN